MTIDAKNLEDMGSTPPYLMAFAVDDGRPKHGVLKKEKDYRGECWVIEAKPYVTQLAKRLFPGCDGKSQGEARFPATVRNQADLAWLMWKYPLEIKNLDEWEAARSATAKHVARVDALARMPVKQEPIKFRGTLKEYQKEGLAYLLNTRRTLLADEAGLGKTPTSLAFLSTSGELPAIVVMQPHMIRQWIRQINQFMGVKTLTWGKKGGRRAWNKTLLEGAPDDVSVCVHVIEGLEPYPLPPADIYLTHYLLLRGWKKTLPEYEFRTLLYDEIQELRHTGTEKYSAASLLSDSCANVFGLSGTPTYNYGNEIWNVLNTISFHCLGDYESFTREWCTGYNNVIVTDPESLGAYLRSEGLFIRRRKSEVLSELPPKRRVVQEVDVDHGLYGELIQPAIEAAVRISGLEKKDFFMKGQLTREAEEITRQATGIAKAKYVVEFTRLLLEAGEKVILVGYHHRVVDIYKEELEQWTPVCITGRETANEKDHAQVSFQTGKTNLIILSLRSGTGLDLYRANCIVFGELDWSPLIHCLDELTEILTKEGFKGVDEVTVGDLVAAFDLQRNSIQFVPAIAKVDRRTKPDEILHKVRTTKIDLAVTGQHRMVVCRGRRTRDGPKHSEWEIIRAADLVGKKRRYIPTAGYEDAKGVPLSDDELRLIGLFLSDGTFNGRSLIIHQAEHQPRNKDIIEILNGAKISWNLFKHRNSGHTTNWYNIPAGGKPRWTEKEVSELKRLKAQGTPNSEIGRRLNRAKTAIYRKWRKMSRGQYTEPGPDKPRKGWKALEVYLDKNLSPLLEDMTIHQLDCLIHGFWLGDGTKKGGKTLRITNTNKTLMDRLQSLCVRRGKTAIIITRKAKTSAGNSVYDIYITGKTMAYLQDGKDRDYFRPDKKGSVNKRVWCIENKLHTIIIRRNGKVTIVGNSQCEDRAHRMGQKDSVLAYYLVCGEGTDNAMQDILGLKTSQFLGIMGDKAETQKDRFLAEKAAREQMQKVIEKLVLEGQKKIKKPETTSVVAPE